MEVFDVLGFFLVCKRWERSARDGEHAQERIGKLVA